MHELFAPVIAPLIESLAPQTIVETGAGAGRLTRQVLGATADAVVHAIDPVPQLDPQLAEEAGARLAVHPERSLGALMRIEDVDLALLDGDPNWSTVRHELAMLEEAAERAGRAAPLVVVHHIHWPYGRRDGYYDPSAIPEAERHEYTDLGLVPGHRDPQAGGLRLAPYCASKDFEPRSGVLTAVEDALADSALEWTVVEIPAFNGAAVLAESQLLAEHDHVSVVLESLRSASFLRGQARRAESARLSAEVALAGLRRTGRTEPPPETTDARAEVSTEAELRSFWLERRIAELEQQLAATSEADQDRVVSTPAAEPGAASVELVAELAEHRAQRQALEWRMQRLEEEIERVTGERSALADERDREHRGAVESTVRLENAERNLEQERAAVTELRARLAELESEAETRERELRELREREELAHGRLAHREDALQASEAKGERLRTQVGELQDSLDAAVERLDQLAELVRRAGLLRRARVRRRLARTFRRATFRRGEPDHPLDAALALVDRDRLEHKAIEAPERSRPDEEPAAGTNETSSIF